MRIKKGVLVALALTLVFAWHYRASLFEITDAASAQHASLTASH